MHHQRKNEEDKLLQVDHTHNGNNFRRQPSFVMKQSWCLSRALRPLRPMIFLSVLTSLVVCANKALISGAEEAQHRSVVTVDRLRETEQKKKLPTFDQGGVIVWLHVPKTVSLH